MNKDEIIRAWRDADYFFNLSEEQRTVLPGNPVGMVELSQDALRNVLGASHSTCFESCHRTIDPCCNDTCFSGGTICCC
ncbi:MAG TPA: mersacidin/lichenicidin family type 2 lantibiotic [Thermoanaerobaculia bacterium]|nr:mersacidin/lichenicidin family type 2 lantibiotic [Thermoanaerobaculia bacterium]